MPVFWGEFVMIPDLPAALLTVALLIRQSEPDSQPTATADATTSQTVESPPPLPRVRPRQWVEPPIENRRRARKARSPEAPSRQTETKPGPRRELIQKTAVTETAHPSISVAPPLPAIASAPQERLPLYGQKRSMIRDAILPLLMLAGGAAILAHVLRKQT